VRISPSFIRLPLRVDAALLAAEVAALPSAAWQQHPEGAPGNTAVPLVAAGGNELDNATTGPMAPTAALLGMPYTRAVLAALGAPIGRTRLMRIAGEGKLGSHVDTNRYWQDHFRVHVPVVTDAAVRFFVDEQSVHMAAGEVWVFDTWRPHGVLNPASFDRIHLVIDTVSSSALWARVRAGATAGLGGAAEGPLIALDDDPPVYETASLPFITSPWHQQAMAGVIRDGLGADAPPRVLDALDAFVSDWHALWVVHGTDPAGVPAYRALIARFDSALFTLPVVELDNRSAFAEVVRQLLLRPAIGALPGGTPSPTTPSPTTPPPTPNVAAPSAAPAPVVAPTIISSRRDIPQLHHPVFIVCPPRTGSTLLFETLSRAKGVHTIGGESHEAFERIAALHPSSHGWSSNALSAADATDDVVHQLSDTFVARARDRDNRPPFGLTPLRLLEKTPKNALRVPFLAAAYPDARFIYLHRNPLPTVSSMLHAWRSGRFVTYPQLPGWYGPKWSLLLTPGWRDLIGLPLEEVAARQWATTHTALLDALEALPDDRWCVASHEQLLADPDGEAKRLCELMGFTWDRPILEALPLSKTTLDEPAADKWKRDLPELERVRHIIDPVAARAAAVLAAPPQGIAPPPPIAVRTEHGRTADPAEVFHSVHTATFPELLAKANSSVIVTTYQSGRVILLRPNEDGTLNTHLRAFNRPMGVAVAGDRIALGTDKSVWWLRNNADLAARLPGGPHDACFVPRSSHVTGDIAIHEMAWAAGELWMVNTRFSCLATLTPGFSFVPRWRPAFVTALAAEDRCHLNGLAIVDGRPRYVTAMGMTDEQQGWRREKVGGGVVIDVDDNSIVAQGLTMPHSPRWHDGALWVLDSGCGDLCKVDMTTGTAEPFVRLPGFTRGLAFIGRYALVGLSKVREHVFAGLPLAEHINERMCGVWMVDTVTATIVGFLRFEGEVEEVFDIQVLPGLRHPDLLEPSNALTGGTFVVPDAAQVAALTGGREG